MNSEMNKWDGFENWADVQDKFRFSNEPMEPEPDEVYCAWYGGGSYEGDAIVIYRRGDKYFVNEGGHCSCNELEGQWSPEEYTKEQLLETLPKRQWYDSEKEARVNYAIAEICKSNPDATEAIRTLEED